jgi:hypothetical protein
MSACSGAEPNTQDPAPTVPATVSATPAPTLRSQPPKTRVSVAIYHCGFLPLRYNGQSWEVSHTPPYDGTRPPPKWKGKGRVVVLTADHLRYRDDSGLELDFAPGDGKLPPCD